MPPLYDYVYMYIGAIISMAPIIRFTCIGIRQIQQSEWTRGRLYLQREKRHNNSLWILTMQPWSSPSSRWRSAETDERRYSVNSWMTQKPWRNIGFLNSLAMIGIIMGSIIFDRIEGHETDSFLSCAKSTGCFKTFVQRFHSKCSFNFIKT
jgi:hypothetical protein